MDPVVSIRNFSKSYGTVPAVRSLTLDVERGILFGLIGPDGAGKTTTMRTLVTLLRPDEGELYVDGHSVRKDISQIRSITGYMPQRFSLYPDLSIDQNLNFFADLFNVPKGEAAARKKRLYQFSRLEEFKTRLSGRLSGGMKQKLALSCTLIHNPVILVLDEPTTGVDPVSRNEFWTILHELKSEGVSVLVSTPYMDEALKCDRVAVMHQGRIMIEGEPKSLSTHLAGRVFGVQDPGLLPHVRDVEALQGVESAQAFGDSIHVTINHDAMQADVQAALSRLAGKNVQLEMVEPSLEDVFISLIRMEACND
jgi:ABC-type multidrug transport system ATPase subunit